MDSQHHHLSRRWALATLVASSLVLLLMGVPTAARAAEIGTTVVSDGGQILTIGSPSQNKLHVWQSEVDLQPKTLAPQTNQTAAFVSQAALSSFAHQLEAGHPNPADLQSDLDDLRETLDGISQQMPPLDAQSGSGQSTSSAPPVTELELQRALERIDAALGACDQAAIDLLNAEQARETLEFELAAGGLSPAQVAEKTGQIAQKTDDLRGIAIRAATDLGPELKAAGREAIDLISRAGLVEAGSDTFRHLLNLLRVQVSRVPERIQAIIAFVERGLKNPSKLHIIVFGVLAGLMAYTGLAQAGEARSEAQILIEDTTGQLINPVPGPEEGGVCRTILREPGQPPSLPPPGDDNLTNAVSCSVPEAPGLGESLASTIGGTLWALVTADATSLPDFPRLFNGLWINTGDGNDEVSVALPADTKTAHLWVDTGPGNDKVRTPISFPAWVVAGEGRDNVVTGNDADIVYGDTPSDVPGSPSQDSLSDIVVTRGGADAAYLGDGHNLALMGPGRDSVEDGTGNSVLVGGNDRDWMRDLGGKSLIVAKEFSGPQVFDELIDCGDQPNPKYAYLSPPIDGVQEESVTCTSGPPFPVPTASELIAAAQDPNGPPPGGAWPWFG